MSATLGIKSILCAVAFAAAPTAPANSNNAAKRPALSYLQPNAAGKCEWVRQSLGDDKSRTVLATFDGSCFGAHAAWSANRQFASVWFDPGNTDTSGMGIAGLPKSKLPELKAPAGLTPRLFRVDLSKGTVELLPQPPRGNLSILGVDKDGNVLALTEEVTAPKQGKGESYYELDGKHLPVPSNVEGEPELAFAFRYAPAKKNWERIETVVSNTGIDYALGAHALKAFQSLGPRSDDFNHVPESTEITDTALHAQVNKLLPNAKPEDGSWMQLKGQPVVVWVENVELPMTTGALRIVSGKQLVEPAQLDFARPDTVTLQSANGVLAVTRMGSGTHPRVYDVATQKLLFRADDVWAAMLE